MIRQKSANMVFGICVFLQAFAANAQMAQKSLSAEHVASEIKSLSGLWTARGDLSMRIEKGLDKLGDAVESFLNGDWFRHAQSIKIPVSVEENGQPLRDPIENLTTTPSLKPADVEEVEFDTAFLGQQSQIDLSKFTRSDHVQPGVLRVDVQVNSIQTYTDFVRFERDDQGHGRPCLTGKQVLRAGIRILGSLNEVVCVPVSSLVPGANYHYEAGDQILNLIIPQAYVRSGERNAVDPKLWDKGMPILYSQYSLMGTQSQGENIQNHSYFGRFDNTLSVHGWQFKNGMTISQSPQSGWSKQVLNAYLRTDVEQLQGEFKLGEIYTSGVLFDTFNLKGATLTSYDEFLSDQDVGYAPVVRGVAETNAAVTITQNGVQIYKINVPPGPFEISDLRGAGYSGTLQVTIEQANGIVKTFLVPYSAQSQMVRKGRLKYALNTGRYNALGIVYRPDVSQATFQYGLFSNLTVYAGVIHAQRYDSVLHGVAMNTFLGTLSVDLTHSSSNLDTGLQKGGRQRWTFNKSIESTGTMMNISHAFHRGGGYLSLNSAMSALNHQNVLLASSNRDQWMASMTQPFGSAGDVSLSWVRSTFDFTAASDSYGVTWRKSFNGMNFSVTANHQLAGAINSSVTTSAKSLAVQLSIPLDRSGYVSSGVNFSADRQTSQTTYSNNFGERKQYSLNATINTDADNKPTLSGSSSMRSEIGYQSLGISVSSNYRNISLGLSGGVALHSGGLTWAPQMSDTMALVYAPGAEGARVNGESGPMVDRHGYAIVSNLQAYRVNEIYLDPRGISQDVELTTTSQQAIVRSGGVARLNYTTITGRGLIMTLSRDDAGVIPFGSTVTNAQGQEVGAVGQGSRVFLRGIAPTGRLFVSWGPNSKDTCTVDFSVPQSDSRQPYDHLMAECKVLPTNLPLLSSEIH